MNDQPSPVNVNVHNPTEPGFTVTLREVWDELRKVSSKLDTIHDLPTDVKILERKVADIDTRYVSKDSVRWWFTAMGGLIIAVAAILGLLLHQ